MFKSIVRKLRGVKNYDEMLTTSLDVIRTQVADENSFIGLIGKDKRKLETFIEYIKPDLIDVAAVNNKQAQCLKLREKTVEAIEQYQINEPFVLNETSEEDKAIFAQAFYGGMSREDAIDRAVYLYFYSEAACACFREVSMQLGDANKNDWFAMYTDISSQYMGHAFKSVIANAKDDIYALRALMPAVERVRDDARRKVLEGHQWDYDKDEIQEERESEERLKQVVEQASVQPIVKAVSNHQIHELAEYVCERYHRALNGELYRIDDNSPSDIANVLLVDSGLILIALAECVDDIETAKRATQKVLLTAFRNIGSFNDLPENESDIIIDIPLKMLEIKKANENNGWMSDICVLSVSWLYELDIKSLSSDKLSALGHASAQTIDDIWQTYAITKNVFGHKLNTDKWLS